MEEACPASLLFDLFICFSLSLSSVGAGSEPTFLTTSDVGVPPASLESRLQPWEKAFLAISSPHFLPPQPFTFFTAEVACPTKVSHHDPTCSWLFPFLFHNLACTLVSLFLPSLPFIVSPRPARHSPPHSPPVSPSLSVTILACLPQAAGSRVPSISLFSLRRSNFLLSHN